MRAISSPSLGDGAPGSRWNGRGRRSSSSSGEGSPGRARSNPAVLGALLEGLLFPLLGLLEALAERLELLLRECLPDLGEHLLLLLVLVVADALDEDHDLGVEGLVLGV